MKTKIFSLTFLLSMLLLSSCYGDLDREDFDQIDPTKFYKNEADINAAVTTIYHRFYINTYGGGGIYSHGRGGINIFTEASTDVMDCRWGDGGTWEMYKKHSWTVDRNDQVAEKYAMYKHISQFRNIIINIENSPVSDNLRLPYIAQARALRAWLMYILYDLFGPIPVATDEILLGNPENKVIIPRPSKEEYVNQMISELNLAIADLPLPSAEVEWGRIDRGIAYMMLLKVYMIDNQWIEAEKVARELMKSEYGYKLLNNYYDCFSLATEKRNGENIWSIVCTADFGVNGWITHVIPGDLPYENPNVERWSGYRMRWDFYHTFDIEDKRLDNIIAEYTSKDNGKIINEQNPGEALEQGALPLKYTVDPDQKGDRSAIDVPVFRYSDVLLTLAECIVRSGGSVTQEAIDLVNKVRTRSGLDDLLLADYTDKDKFFEMLLLERGHEFYCEGHRRTDLIRFGKYIEFNKKVLGSETADHKVLFPIPTKYIVESQGQVLQNPGYQ